MHFATQSQWLHLNSHTHTKTVTAFWRAVEVLAIAEFTTKLNLIALNQRHETHTYRHTYTSANNPSTWSSRVRTGAGWSYINLSELVKDKKKYIHTQTCKHTHRYGHSQCIAFEMTSRGSRDIGLQGQVDKQGDSQTCGMMVHYWHPDLCANEAICNVIVADRLSLQGQHF